MALREAVLQNLGIAVLPDYLAKDNPSLVSILEDVDMPVFYTYFVYPGGFEGYKTGQCFS